MNPPTNLFAEQRAMMTWARSRRTRQPAPTALTAPGCPTSANAETRLQARLQLVRNMIWIRQVDALASTYARTLAALGEARFRWNAAAFVARFPGCVADLEDAGADFPSFLRQQADHAVGAVAGLAKIEWAISCAFRAEDFAGAPVAEAAACEVALAPATHLVALSSEQVANVRAAFPEAFARAPFNDVVVVHRTDERVRVIVPTLPEHRCLTAATSSPSFGDVCAAFADQPEQLAQTLRSLLDREVVFLRRLP